MSGAASLLDVTSDDVGKLDDKKLRELIALLCEAEAERNGFPRTAVTSGGHQDAPDGGVDVRVELATLEWSGNIPKPLTIFQSKDSEMGPAKIQAEMRPGGVLRTVIFEVLSRGGAYVIVSNRDNASDLAYQGRKTAMENAVSAEFPDHRGALQFYDRSRLATWTRSHPGVVLWLRNAIGRPLHGWKTWAELQSIYDTKFLVDDVVRLRTPQLPNTEDMGMLDGISCLRLALRLEGSSVRLAGLSGVGKTRLVQALFDPTVGTDALPSHEFVYTDISDDPIPAPLEICRQLHAEGRSTIVVVDNCPPELHTKLTNYVAQSKCRIRLLTVEYDVREEEYEETSVFRMEPASVDLVENLIRIRFPELRSPDPHIIAEFSGGNARVAISLAKTVNRGETLSGLKKGDLFRRLFHQRNEISEELLTVARCCSLVYSFEFENKNGYSSELLVL
ncbi:MAG: hypothetical protein AAB214_08510, partial [Fibrobacterota bacterium]